MKVYKIRLMFFRLANQTERGLDYYGDPIIIGVKLEDEEKAKEIIEYSKTTNYHYLELRDDIYHEDEEMYARYIAPKLRDYKKLFEEEQD